MNGDWNKALAESMMQNKWTAAAAVLTEPEIPVTEEMIAEGRGAYDLDLTTYPCGQWDWDRALQAIYRAMRAKEPSGNETIQSIQHYYETLLDKADAERDAALARAEVAERHRKEMFELKEHYRSRMHAAETRLAERDASARRWVKFGCVLALLLPFAARAQPAAAPDAMQSFTYTPIQDAIYLRLKQCEMVMNSIAADRDQLQTRMAAAKRAVPDLDDQIAAVEKAEKIATQAKPAEPKK